MCTPAIAVIGSLLGGVVQAAGVQAQANAQADAEERRAKFAERQKEINQTQASFDRKRTLQQRAQVIGNNRAAGAERGLSETGSLVEVMYDNDLEVSQNLEAIRFKAAGERDNLTYEARAARARASSARRAGGIGAFGAILGGVTTAATRLGKSYYSTS